MYIGMGCAGCFGAPFILVIEYSGKAFTTYIGIAIAIPFSLGMVLFGIEAYYIRDWQTLQLVSLAPWLILIPILWKIVPESPRWLISMKRYQTSNIKKNILLTHVYLYYINKQGSVAWELLCRLLLL